MGHGDTDAIDSDYDTDTVTVRTKPCWICGQYSRVIMPAVVFGKWEGQDVHIDKAWPDGSAADRQLLRTGIHPKCWDEEFPSKPLEETK